MHKNRTAKGFTMAELVIAISITTVIGLAVTGMAVGLSNIQEHSRNYYESLQTSRIASERLQEMLRSALLVTASSDDALILWARDERDPEKINITEIVYIYLDRDLRELRMRSVVFPDSMNKDTAASLDDTVGMGAADDTKVILEAGKLPMYDSVQVLAEKVTDFEVYTDLDPPKTRAVKFIISIGEGDEMVTLIGGATLRAKWDW